MGRRITVLIIISMSIILLISYFQLQEYFSDDDRWTEIIIDEGDNSIFTGHKPSEIAENMALALNVTPLDHKIQKDQACCITEYRFHYQKNTTIIIFIEEKSRSLWSIFRSPINIYCNLDLGTNISADPVGMSEKVENLWKTFLKGFDININDDDLNISFRALNENRWKMYIRQTCNDIHPLKNTGSILTIDDNKIIDNVDIYKWSKVKIIRDFVIDDDRARDIIDNEIPELNINKTQLNFTGYSYFSDNVYFYFRYYYEFDNDSIYKPGILIFYTDKNGTLVEIQTTNRTFSFYIRVDNGEFVCNDNGIRKLREI